MLSLLRSPPNVLLGLKPNSISDPFSFFLLQDCLSGTDTDGTEDGNESM